MAEVNFFYEITHLTVECLSHNTVTWLYNSGEKQYKLWQTWYRTRKMEATKLEVNNDI